MEGIRCARCGPQLTVNSHEIDQSESSHDVVSGLNSHFLAGS